MHKNFQRAKLYIIQKKKNNNNRKAYKEIIYSQRKEITQNG